MIFFTNVAIATEMWISLFQVTGLYWHHVFSWCVCACGSGDGGIMCVSGGWVGLSVCGEVEVCEAVDGDKFYAC